MPPRASFETKLAVARARKNGKSWKEAADAGGVSRMSAYRWATEQDDDWTAAVRAVEEHDARVEPELPEVWAGDRGAIIAPQPTTNAAMNSLIRAGARKVTA